MLCGDEYQRSMERQSVWNLHDRGTQSDFKEQHNTIKHLVIVVIPLWILCLSCKLRIFSFIEFELNLIKYNHRGLALTDFYAHTFEQPERQLSQSP